MRISDWSSDVCSSDLEQRPGQWWVLHGSHLMLARDLTNAQCQMVAALRNATRRSHRIGIVLQRDREVGGVRDDDIRRRDRRHHAPPRPLEPNLAQPLLDHRIAFALLRSEEHTSELQSLMRISYAVFCLKKKKKP